MCSPKAGAGPGRVAGGAAQLHRQAELADRAELRLVDLDDHLARPDQLGVERLVEVEDRLDAAVVLVVEGAPLVAGAGAEDRGDLAPRRREPGASNCFSIRSGRPTPLQKAAQNFGSSAPQLTQPSAAS